MSPRKIGSDLNLQIRRNIRTSAHVRRAKKKTGIRVTRQLTKSRLQESLRGVGMEFRYLLRVRESSKAATLGTSFLRKNRLTKARILRTGLFSSQEKAVKWAQMYRVLPSELIELGFSAQVIASVYGRGFMMRALTPKQLRASGLSLRRLKREHNLERRHSLASLIKAGYTERELLSAGFSKTAIRQQKKIK